LEASRLVTDEYSAKILVATFRRPRSAIDMSREYGIPIAACGGDHLLRGLQDGLHVLS